MQTPIYTITDQGKYDQENSVAAVRPLGTVEFGNCLMLFTTRQSALDFIAQGRISGDAAPLQISDKSYFLRLLSDAKQLGIKKTIENVNTTATGVRGDFADVDSWLRKNQ